MSGITGKPPAASKALRSTKIAWSPVAMPVQRERPFIMHATAFSTHGRPSMVTSKRPQRAPVRDRVVDVLCGARRQERIGVQEQEHVAARVTSAGVHLGRASGIRDQRAIAQQLRDRERRVPAAAVDDDDLVPLRAQRLQPGERRGIVDASSSVGMMIDSRIDRPRQFPELPATIACARR
jgi:hypothetical protein